MRIDGVKTLRARQFREDAGPLAHPVRPRNMSRSTISIRRPSTRRAPNSCGCSRHRRARRLSESLDLYFERHDGEACTIEQFVKCFQDATGEDLEQFSIWWRQAGTPRVKVDESYDAATRRHVVRLSQSTAPTPGQTEKRLLDIPLRLAVLTREGRDATPEDRRLIRLRDQSMELAFDELDARPLVSINQGFSAPVILERQLDDAEPGRAPAA